VPHASRQLKRETAFDAAATTSERAVPREDLAAPPAAAVSYIDRNRAAWDRLAPAYVADGRRSWQEDELRWGMWRTPESQLRLLDGFGYGEDAIELGCGTAAVCAWLARRGMRPVGVDVAGAQIENAEKLQREFGVRFPLVRSNAEHVAFDQESFDLAVSEYGASVWCDPRRWLPEANRLLRPEGKLIFVTNSALLLACTPVDGGAVGDCLVRDYFASNVVEFAHDGPVEFHLTHGQWVRLLRATGFVLDDLVEVRPEAGAEPRFDFVSAEWANRWPSEEIWVAHKAS
jgi:SAM-dependent methyltransferase